MTRREGLADHAYDLLRTLAAGDRPKYVNPSTRRRLRDRGFITVTREPRKPGGWRYTCAITDAGRVALATLPRIRPCIGRLP